MKSDRGKGAHAGVAEAEKQRAPDAEDMILSL
jgi:hypothetical protein